MKMSLSESPPISAVRIGDRSVGPGCPVFIVAEAGVNHDGSVKTALELVDAAVAAGADAVKFQMFRASSLVTRSAPTVSYQKRRVRTRSQRAMLEKLELSLDALARIKQHCDQREILFLATPFGPEEAARLAGLGGAAVKIASTDLPNRPLLSAAEATGLPILLSTGASTEEEIVDTVQRLQHSTARDRLVLLHCISCYPTPIERINLRAISTLAERFGVPVGLSDHTLSTHTGGWAVAAGACLLEKHFTLDPNRKGPDHAMSLPPDRMAEYIARARQAQRALGTGTLGMKPEEKEVRYAARRSIVAAADIPAGAVLTQSMLALKRPGTGLPPTALDHLTGRQTTVSIPRDTILTWDMVR